jgi:hypothetical protein
VWRTDTFKRSQLFSCEDLGDYFDVRNFYSWILGGTSSGLAFCRVLSVWTLKKS